MVTAFWKATHGAFSLLSPVAHYLFLLWAMDISGAYRYFCCNVNDFGVKSWIKKSGGLIVAFIFQWLFMGIMLLNDPKGALFDMRHTPTGLQEHNKMFQNQCANLQTFFENAGFLSIFYDISCGFVVLFNDPYALIFVVLAAIVGIVFGALPGLTARPQSR